MDEFICPRCGNSRVRTTKSARTPDGKSVAMKNIIANNPKLTSKVGKILWGLVALIFVGFFIVSISISKSDDEIMCSSVIGIIGLALSAVFYRYYIRIAEAEIMYSHTCPSCDNQWNTTA